MTATELIPAGLPLPARWGGPDWDRVHQLMSQWLVGYGSANTRLAYRGDVEAWFAYCARSGLDPLGAELRRPHVDGWMRAMEVAREAPSTRRRRLNATSAFYRWLVNEEHVLRNPAAPVRRPAVDRDLTRTAGLTEIQLVALLTVTDTSGHEHAARESFAFRLMASNGLRVGSVCSANLADLGTVQGARGLTYRAKGERTAFAPFNRPTIVACDDYLAARAAQAGKEIERRGRAGDRPLFTLYGSEERATKSSFTAALRRLAFEAFEPELAERVTPHWLRHTFTTLSLNHGADLRDVQDALGHASSDTTRLYDDDRHNIDRNPTHRLAATVARR